MITINPHGSMPGTEDFMIHYSGYTPSITTNTKFKITTEIKTITSCSVYCLGSPEVEVTVEAEMIPISTTTDSNGNISVIFTVPAYHIAYFDIVGLKSKNPPPMTERSVLQSGVTMNFEGYHRHLGINSPKLDPTRSLSVGPNNAGKILVVDSTGGFTLMDAPLLTTLGAFSITQVETTSVDELHGIRPEYPIFLPQSQLGDVDLTITESTNADKYKYRVEKLLSGIWTVIIDSELMDPASPPSETLKNLDWRTPVGSGNPLLKVIAYSHLTTTGAYRATDPVYIQITLPES